MNTFTKSIFITYFLLQGSIQIQAQVGIGTNSPNASAKLEVASTTQGLLPPRMNTTQRNAITSPAAGLIIFNTSTNGLEIRTSTDWLSLRASTASQEYPSVQIGTQSWMEKNLEVTTFRNGELIPYVTDGASWIGLTSPAWCYFNNDPSSGYGKLYNWYAVVDSRGLCPAGWHAPSDAEWSTLETSLGGSTGAGGKMKTIGTARWTSPNTDAANSSGFAGLPGGSRSTDGRFYDGGTYGFWWSTTENNFNDAFARYLVYNSGDFGRNYKQRLSGLSVRCLKD